MSDSFPEIKVNKGLVGSVVLLIVVLIFLWKSSVKLDAGEAGVLFKTFDDGVDIEQTLGEGFHIIMPWTKVIKYDIRQQELKEKMNVLSSNGLKMDIDMSIWYEPLFQKLPLLHQKKGPGYETKIVKPAIRSALREVIGRYTAEEVFSEKRNIIASEIKELTEPLLGSQYLQTNEVFIRKITLPSTYKQAIENKLKQKQESEAYEFRLEKAAKEAQRLKIEAEGKATANRILSASLTDKILREKGIEATLQLATSQNSKVVVVGNQDGMPLILGDK